MPLVVGELVEYLSVKDNTGPALASAEKNFTATSGKIGGLANALQSGALAGMSAAVTDFGMKSFEASNSFRANMANIASLMPGNTARVGELTGAIERMQISLGKSQEDLTKAAYDTVSAYGDTKDTIASVELAAKTAAAGVSTTKEAIDLISATTKAYGDTSLAAQGKVSDLALMTVRLGKTTLPELAGAIGSVTPLTKALGVSQEELYTTFATLTGVTGKASEVSTQFRGVLQGLMAPTTEMAKLMQSLGYENGAAMIQALGLHGTITAITKAAQESGKPLQDYLGSIEGQTGALSLAGAQSEDFTAKLKQMEGAAGTTNAAFKEQTEGVNKAGHMYEQAKQAWQVFMQETGKFGPVLQAGGAVLSLWQGFRTLKAMTDIAKVATAAHTVETIANSGATTVNTGLTAANAKAHDAQAVAVGRATGALMANSGAAAGGVGILGRLAGMAGSVGTAITGAVGALGGLAMTAAWGGVVAGIAAVLAELGGIWYYTDKAKKEAERGKKLDAENLPKIAAINKSAQAHAAQAREMGYGSMTALQDKAAAGDKKAIADLEKVMGGQNRYSDSGRQKAGMGTYVGNQSPAAAAATVAQAGGTTPTRTATATPAQPWVNQAYVDQQRLLSAGLQGAQAMMPITGIPMPGAPTPAPVQPVTVVVNVNGDAAKLMDWTQETAKQQAGAVIRNMVQNAPGVRR